MLPTDRETLKAMLGALDSIAAHLEKWHPITAQSLSTTSGFHEAGKRVKAAVEDIREEVANQYNLVDKIEGEFWGAIEAVRRLKEEMKREDDPSGMGQAGA